MLPLPIDASVPQILDSLRSHNSLVLVAPPGAGKTTRIPPAIINLLSKENPNLIMLQPRRVAARAAAERIAHEQQWRLGGEVGYAIRFEKRYGPHTRIRILTEAILTRMLLDDPFLESIGCVILDEFHERNLHTDLALALLREIQQTVRPDLKIVIMSATMDAQPASAFLANAPIVNVPGRAFDVDIFYRPPDKISTTGPRKLDPQIAGPLAEALQHEGDILVFLPGAGEIDRIQRTQSQSSVLSTQSSILLPLHGRLTAEEQQRALSPDPQGRRKIILATNIAETSLTIDGVRTVIDSGLARIASYDPDRGMDRLDLERISQASATQRAGRAGRQATGRAYRLWSAQEHKHLAAYSLPEIQRIDLAWTVLAVHAWAGAGASVRKFGWFEQPDESRLAAAEELLTLLGALDRGTLTAPGRAMLRVPAHPRIARLLLAAASTPLQADAAALAAVLSDDRRSAESRDPLSDLHRLPDHLRATRDQFDAIGRQVSYAQIETQKSKIENLPDLLLLAYPDRVAKCRGSDPHSAVMVGGSGVRLAPEALTTAVAETGLFIALDAHHDPRNRKAEALVHTATPIDTTTLERLFPEMMHTATALEYDAKKGKVVALTRRLYHDLIIDEDPHGQIDLEAAAEVLASALVPIAREIFMKDEASHRLLARVALLRHCMPEHPWPRFDETELMQLMAHACAGKRSRAEVTESHSLTAALRTALLYPLDRLLDQHAPETLAVPSGSHIRIQYTLLPPAMNNEKSTMENPPPPPPPVLAVRLQELFGLMDTPRIAAGRVPVLLHLLSPGFKPMQITTDLRSFWSSGYFEVRKDLRVRYPKHKWPEDPLTAAPEAKGRRR